MTADYLLAGGGDAELERLALQARVWEPAAERMLQRIPLPPEARCLDLGCGAMGALGPLARAAGPGGSVVGIEADPASLAAARRWLDAQHFGNVMVREGDAYATGYPDGAFDLVHVRFLLASVGRDDALLRECVRLLRPGRGVLALQEPDASSWGCWPPRPGWDALKQAILTAFRLGGGDLDAGRRIFSMLRGSGLEDVQARAEVQVLPPGHPYRRLPAQFAASLRRRILDGGILEEPDLEAAIEDVEAAAADSDTLVTTFIVVQAWGRRAG
jgi:SAM-dependent methyltransferase